MKNLVQRITFTFLVFFTALKSFAWGERGHHIICEAATRLVQDENLKKFLSHRGDLMGHVCNIPDIYWRGLGEEGKSGNATHFINSELLNLPISAVPTDLQAVVTRADSLKIDMPEQVGSLWWRAEQFYKRAGVAARRASGATPPVDAASEQDAEQPYNAAIYEFEVNAALMGHFVGDVSMPYHSSLDHDGWETGHGGIHRFYEDAVVDSYPLSLLQTVFDKAKGIRRKPHVRDAKVVERMKEMSIIGFAEIAKVRTLDKISVPSKVEGPVKTPAKRLPLEAAAKVFKPLIVQELARSAALLAEFWDDIYLEAGRPDLSHYKSFRYPLNPTFIPPDYFPAPPPPPETKGDTGAASGAE